jgi:tRNA1(Val) A37 N6-methylase TrmN6
VTDAPATPALVTDDRFLGGRLTIRQPAKGFRAGLDAVLLAAACPAQAGQRVLDLGCGVGTASLCLLARVQGAHVAGLEIDPQTADLARRNAAANGLDTVFSVLTGDATSPWSALAEAGCPRDCMDHAIANPPFFDEEQHRVSVDAAKRTARYLKPEKLHLWLRTMATALHASGTATVIHTPDSLPSLLPSFASRFGGLIVKPVHPKAEAPAVRVIVHGMKGSRAPTKLLPPLVLQDGQGQQTAEAEAILRNAHALVLS